MELLDRFDRVRVEQGPERLLGPALVGDQRLEHRPHHIQLHVQLQHTGHAQFGRMRALRLSMDHVEFGRMRALGLSIHYAKFGRMRVLGLSINYGEFGRMPAICN